MSITSYAQNFEDVMLWRALGHVERGSYIDIGAQDPVVDSVSRAFHERDWLGVHVEPTPHYAELLRQQRPGDIVIQAAIGNGPAVLRFFEIPHTGISTADANIAAQHCERGFEVHEIAVPSVTLSAVFEVCAQTEIHWLKIDVEGFEEQVILSWGTSAVRPWIVVVESTLPLSQIESHESWEPKLVGHGYSPVYFDGLNRYYVSDAHPELKAAFASPPNVFDGFTLNGTASATFHKLIEARHQEKISEILAQVEQQKQSTNSEIERLNLSLASLDKTHVEHDQNRAQREQALAEQTSQAKQELESILRNQVQREQEVGAQLLDIQQQAAQEKTLLASSHNEQERVLHREHTEREQVLNQQLQVGQQELHNQHNDRTKREQEVTAELLALHKQAAKETAEQARSHSEHERELHLQHTKREEALRQQLQARQQELQNLQKDRARREQEVGAQLLAIQQQASQEAAEQARKHWEQASALHRHRAERERAFNLHLQAGQQELRRLEQDRAQREKEHAEQTSQSRQALESLLRNQVQREQEVIAQLLVIQQQAEQEKDEQARQHREQERALQRQHAGREQALIQQQEAAQEERRQQEHEWAQREDALGKEITALQNEVQALHQAQQLQAQQHGLEISTRLDEHARLLEACAALEAQLQTEMQSGQQASLHLRQLLAEVQHSLEMTHTSLSWRITAPLRKLAGLFNSNKNHTPAPVSFSEPITPERGMQIATDAPPITVTQASLAPTMPPLAQPTSSNMPTIASTLAELLARHDQQFVHCAYQTLLGRAPDPEGLGYYLGRLRTGFSKIQILAQLRLSNEGKTYAAKLPGLDTAIRRHQKEQYPLIGGLFRRLNGGEGNHPTGRKLRGIENQLFLLSDESNRRFNQLETALVALHDLVLQQTQSVVATPDKALLIIPDAASISPIQSPEPDGLKQLSPRAKDIYFQLKKVVVIQAGRAV